MDKNKEFACENKLRPATAIRVLQICKDYALEGENTL